MKIYNKEIKIQTTKNIDDFNILCFSDLHYSKLMGKDFLVTLSNYILKENPTYVCFLGDLVNDESWCEVISFLATISNYIPIILVEGNREMNKFDAYGKTQYNKHAIPDGAKLLLKSIKNIYYLRDNESITLSNIKFIGTEFYHHTHINDLIEQLNTSKIQLKEDSYNIILSHNTLLMDDETFKKLNDKYRNIDITISGHTHNALIPFYLDNLIKNNKGIYSYEEGLFPKNARGEKVLEYNQKKINCVYVPPIRTFSEENILYNHLNLLYPPAVKTIKVRKK